MLYKTHSIISNDILGAAMRVHSAIGPGLMESAYEACLAYELHSRGRMVETQVAVPLHYYDVKLDVGYRLDLLVDGVVAVELKATSKILPIHKAQLLSYLRPRKLKVGLLINFHVLHTRDGIRRILNASGEY